MLRNAAQGIAFGIEKKYKTEMILLLNFTYPPPFGLPDTNGQTLSTRGSLDRRQDLASSCMRVREPLTKTQRRNLI
jgi:hypothetical protein